MQSKRTLKNPDLSWGLKKWISHLMRQKSLARLVIVGPVCMCMCMCRHCSRYLLSVFWMLYADGTQLFQHRMQQIVSWVIQYQLKSRVKGFVLERNTGVNWSIAKRPKPKSAPCASELHVKLRTGKNNASCALSGRDSLDSVRSRSILECGGYSWEILQWEYSVAQKQQVPTCSNQVALNLVC